MKKRILIFFPEGNLPYAPSVLNLYDELTKTFEVEILAKAFGSFQLSRNVSQISPTPGAVSRWTHRIRRFTKTGKGFWYDDLNSFHIYNFLRDHLKRKQYDEVIAFDLLGTAIAQQLHNHVHFFSLEISNLKFLDKIDLGRLRSVIIQRRDRYQYLFKQDIANIFYIQNAPVYVELPEVKTPRNGLIFSGYASKGFGIYAAINFVNAYKDYQLTVKGSSEPELLDNVVIHFSHLEYDGRLQFDRSYVDEREMHLDLSRFKIGFCFYDFRFPYINNFNYISAPSGKLFRYFAAGVPVVAINIPGLSYVKEFEAGVLIDDLSPQSIRNAIDKIEKDYPKYSSNCLKAARYFSFDNAAKPLIEFLSI